MYLQNEIFSSDKLDDIHAVDAVESLVAFRIPFALSWQANGDTSSRFMRASGD
jgi:hypothetical protein